MRAGMFSMLTTMVLAASCTTPSTSDLSPPKDTPDTGLWLPEGVTFRVIAQKGMALKNNGVLDSMLDMNAFVPLKDNKALMVISHEKVPGGASVLHLTRHAADWQTTGGQAVDFRQVRGASTVYNCAGVTTAWGTVLSSEEYPLNPAELLKYRIEFPQLSDNPLDYGWVVEIDPVNAIALRKLEALGRFNHKGIAIMPDLRTVFLGDDDVQGVLFKFVAEAPSDLSRGTLYAFRRDTTQWLPIPPDQLTQARAAALAAGATPFSRIEDVEFNHYDGYVYFSETGDNTKSGADRYGRIWRLNPETSQLSVFMAGDPTSSFVNPDNLAVVPLTGELMIAEDRYIELMAPTPGQPNNSVFVANHIGHLTRFASVPRGAEPTGIVFTPDGSLLMNIQHPTPPWIDSLIQITTPTSQVQ